MMAEEMDVRVGSVGRSAFGFERYTLSIATHLRAHFKKIDEVIGESSESYDESLPVVLQDQDENVKKPSAIKGYDALESLSIGIFGEWGSGKTKLLRGIEREFDGDEHIVPVFFNAWRYEKEPHIIIPLFKTLLHAVKERSKDEDPRWKNVLVNIRLLTFSLLSGFSAEFAGLKFDAKNAIEQFFKMQGGDLATLDEFERMDVLESIYYDIPQKIETVSVNHEVKFLFLIDDLDRCLPENSLKMLEGIKLFLDIPGCAFVLAVDDDVIERGVLHHYWEYLKKELHPEKTTELDNEVAKETLPITGSEYLEKMIQLPFTLPLLHETQVKEFLRARYDEKKFPDDLIERFAKSVAPVPRKIIRAAELFLLKKKLLDDEKEDSLPISDYDLLRLVSLELFAPSLFRLAKKEYPRLKVFTVLNGWRDFKETKVAKGEDGEKKRAEEVVNDSLEYFTNIESVFIDGAPNEGDKRKFKMVLESLKAEYASRVKFDLDGIFKEPIHDLALERYFYIQQIEKKRKERGKDEKQQVVLSDKRQEELLKSLKSPKELDWKVALDELEGQRLSSSDSESIIRHIEVGDITVTLKWLVAIRPNLEDTVIETILPYLKMEVVRIKSGTFVMGSDDGDADEKPVHEVSIAYDFEMGSYPVTFEEYDLFCDDTNRKRADDEGWGRERRPIINVSWEDAQAYGAWLSALTKQTYRLPSEAEWEYAARAGTRTRWSFGDDESKLDEYAWYDKNSGGKTHLVGEKEPNPWGLYDMHGNVWEWCEDDYVDSYEKTPRDGSAYKDKDAKSKVLRGGSWFNDAGSTRSSIRSRVVPDYRSRGGGFRLLRTLPS